MGDYNVNILKEFFLNDTTHIHESQIFSTYYYHKLINIPTRVRKKSSTLLDKIYTNLDCYDSCTSGILRFLSQSYHYPVFTMRKKCNSRATNKIYNKKNP